MKLNVPAVVGTPDTTPELERVSPGGSVPPITSHVYGPVPPETVNVWL
ncbi:MAG TPA: hypothetical protein VIM84_13020 [Gemmatimonadales bacterium]